MDLIDRFSYIMKINQLTASAFADKIGVQRSSVSHVLSGRNKPSLEFIQKILDTFPRVDANWLINGTTNAKANKEDYSKTVSQEELQETRTVETVATVEEEVKAASNAETKVISRILVFYSDNTFEEFKP